MHGGVSHARGGVELQATLFFGNLLMCPVSCLICFEHLEVLMHNKLFLLAVLNGSAAKNALVVSVSPRFSPQTGLRNLSNRQTIENIPSLSEVIMLIDAA